MSTLFATDVLYQLYFKKVFFQLINELIPSICKSNDIEPPSSTQNVSLQNFICQ